MSSKPLKNTIEVKNVSIGYNKKKHSQIVLEDISFSSEKGELISIVGTNGIGKSKLLKTLQTSFYTTRHLHLHDV